MKFQKYIVVGVFGLGLIAPVFADDSAKQKEEFAAHKTEIMGELDQHIQKLQEHKTCVSNAADREAMKACRATMKEFRKGERKEHHDRRKAFMKKRLDKMDAEKSE